MKRFICLILTIMMFLSMVTSSVFAASPAPYSAGSFKEITTTEGVSITDDYGVVHTAYFNRFEEVDGVLYVVMDYTASRKYNIVNDVVVEKYNYRNGQLWEMTSADFKRGLLTNMEVCIALDREVIKNEEYIYIRLWLSDNKNNKDGYHASILTKIDNPYYELAISSIKVGTYSLGVDGKRQITYSVFPSNTTMDTKMKYEVEDTSIATVDENGLITAVSMGTTTLILTSVNGVSAETTITVGKPIESISFSQTEVYLEQYKTASILVNVYPEDAAGRYTLIAPNPEIVRYDVYGNKLNLNVWGPGVTEIKAIADNGVEAVCKVTVDYPIKYINFNSHKQELKYGETVQLSVKFEPTKTNADRTIVWSSDNEAVVTVDSDGVIHTHSAGVAYVTATASNGKNTKTWFRVSNDITVLELSDNEVDLSYGKTYQLSWDCYPLNTTSDKTVSWSSSNKKVATVSKGKISAVGPGTAIITGKTKNGVTAKCIVNVDLLEPVINVTRSSGTALKVSWKKISGASGYEVYRSTSLDGEYTKVKAVNSSTVSLTDFGRVSGETYFYKVRAYRTVSGKKVYGDMSEPVGYAPLATPSVTAVRDSYESIALSWKDVAGASYYEVYRSESKAGEYELIDYVVDSSYLDSGLLSGVTYYYQVCAIKNEMLLASVSAKSSVKSAKTSLDKPVISVVDAGVNRVHLGWDDVDGVAVYEVYRSTSAKGKFVLAGSVNENEFVDTTVALGKTYYYKVRGYRNEAYEEVVYSGYSSVINYKVVLPKINSFEAVRENGVVTICFDGVDDADGYEVYRATSKSGKYTLLKDMTDVEFVDESISASKSYYYKARAYHLVKGKKVYSAYTSVVSCLK